MKVVWVSPQVLPSTDEEASADLVVWTSHVAPDSHLLPDAQRVLTAADLFSDIEDIRLESWTAARELWRDTPSFRGIRLFEAFEDSVADSIEEAIVRERVLRRIVAETRVGDEVVVRAEPGLQMNGAVARLRELGRVVQVDPVRSKKTGERWRQRLRILLAEAKRGPRRFGATLLERIDHVYRVSPTLGPLVLPRSERQFRAERFLAYSTAQVFSGTILKYEPLIQNTCWVVSNSAAAQPLVSAGRSYRYVWEYRRRMGTSKEAIRKHVSLLMEAVRDRPAFKMLEEQNLTDDFERRALPVSATIVCLAQGMFDEVEPARVIVANQGSLHEAIVLAEARHRSIPSLMLQHGVFGNDYLGAQELRAEELWVRGSFWRDMLPETMQAATKIVAAPQRLGERTLDGSQHDAIVYLSSPVDNSRFRTLTETREIVERCLQAAKASRRLLIVRVHPRERRELYVEWLGGERSPWHQIDPGWTLDELLSRARVVVTYSSTIFMECLSRGVPLISFEWHPFRFKEAMKQEGVFVFAQSLAHLETLIEQSEAHSENRATRQIARASRFDITEP